MARRRSAFVTPAVAGLGALAVAGVVYWVVRSSRSAVAAPPARRTRPAPLPEPPAPDEAEAQWERERSAEPLPSVRGTPDEVETPAFDDGTPRARRGAKLPVQGVGDNFAPGYAPVDRGAPMAPTSPDAIWPVKTDSRAYLQVSYWSDKGVRGRSGNAFGAKRKDSSGGSMFHAGMDLGGDEGDVVVAPEDGTVVDIVKFYHGTWALYLRTRDDVVLNLGEIAYPSWREFGITPGAAVKRGEPVARVGQMFEGSMLHVEAWDGGGLTDEQMRLFLRQGLSSGGLVWRDRSAPPERLLDPSAYLLQASENQYILDQSAS
jgi:murein DD-endopeptidase MepM/ murein hydrolase activator NlpD